MRLFLITAALLVVIGTGCASTQTLPLTPPTPVAGQGTAPGAPAPTGTECLSQARVDAIMKDAQRFPTNSNDRIGTAITALDAEFNTNPAIGYRSNVPGNSAGGVPLDNPGPAGKAIFWSNIPSVNFLPLVMNTGVAGDIGKNFIPMAGFWQGDGVHGWGLANVYTGVTPRTAYTAVRVCP